ncbi:hypothetical protein BDR05DRAFT_348846 [Suillus weaverae]|nr:hypothetical protein BDR05DRAFT_348846 [Suillus weaverae]
MIAIAGTIGTGLFLGTGRSLAQGGPASMLICYGIVGFIVYVTLLLLGEMHATQYPVAGFFKIYRQRSNRLRIPRASCPILAWRRTDTTVYSLLIDGLSMGKYKV